MERQMSMHVAELSMRVLATLEEAGEETISTLINTVFEPAGSEAEIADLKLALDSLVQQGLTQLSTARAGQRLEELPRQASIDEIAKISTRLSFDGSSKTWRDPQHSGPPFADDEQYVVLTRAGRMKSVEILTARGYQWWRPQR